MVARVNSLACKALLLCLAAMSSSYMADELVSYSIKLENHLFFPSRLEVPRNTKFKLIIENKDSSLEEFDSFDLNREKVLFPGRKVTLYIGPLSEGEYDFFGEYNRSTATGVIVAVSKQMLEKKTEEITNAH
ncbi:MAG: cupredoxin domain-containing protein [Gammaproteobacteria bacterium]|nr:cupredoxin domain-containing protein [Gammaproteobacteria bacterium]NNJ72049.1 cupredoxin domain-containing protein [Enterobacterales bacterium]